jgi:hypothetical protein
MISNNIFFISYICAFKNKKNMKCKHVLLSILMIIVWSCTEESKKDTGRNTLERIEKEQEIENDVKKPLSFKIIRIEQKVFKYKNKDSIAKAIQEHPYFANKFLQRNQYPHDSVLINTLFKLSLNPAIDTLYQTTQSVFDDMYDIGLELEILFDNLKKFDPKFKIPKIYTMLTGMGHDMMVDDSIIVIGLDFFLAEKSKYKPQLPLYMLKRYRKEYIVPMIASLISTKYNENDYLDNSMIAEMVYYGKSYYFVKEMLPNIEDTILVGYGKEVLKDVIKNQDIIWAHFVEKSLLFETKHDIVTKYTGERPSVFEIGSNCPGRIGRWLGYEIVKSYVKKNEPTLRQLMATKDARSIFYKSGYKPKK